MVDDRILKIIQEEDKRNPLTDEEIAQQLNILRETVTLTRKQLTIADSRNRRKQALLKDIISIEEEEGELSDRKMTLLLNERGYEIGKYAVGKLRAELTPRLTNDNNKWRQIQADDPFNQFIGYDGSLKNQISKAKAAVMYPPHGLHTLIYGPSGVGKSYLAELMHTYALGTDNFVAGAPYYEFNCADYADNPQLLLAQLFGYMKGAFTGAEDSQKGIVELCDGGILLLDEVHRLPAEGQEILFYLMDKGKFRRLGEVDNKRTSNLMIIAATTEDPESMLLLTFRRRIPMSIEIPPIKERPLYEKMQFIQNYFIQESNRLNQELQVRKEVLQCLLSVDYPGNVGQLKSDIQVCCAKAFLESKIHNQQEIVVSLDSLPGSLKSQHNWRNPSKAVESMLEGDVIYSDKGSMLRNAENKNSNKPKIYEILENRYDQLKSEGHSNDEINDILVLEVEQVLTHHIKQVEESQFSFYDLANIVGEDSLMITKEIYELAKKELVCLKENIIFPLAIHINSSIDHIKRSRKYINSDFDEIKQQYKKEYRVAAEIVNLINKKYYINLADQEAVFLAMYFSRFQNMDKVLDGKIGLLIISHGRVAGGMADVANSIIGVNHAVGLEMDLKTPPAVMLKETVECVKQLDQGKGCIILADMGSLLTFGDKIKEQTGIPVEIVGRVDTLMVIDCLRRVLMTDESLKEITRDISQSKDDLVISNKKERSKKACILCLCITGQGAAKSIETLIQQRLKSVMDGIVIVTRGYIENSKVENIVHEIEVEYELLAIVGTINPEIKEYPFISISDIYNIKGISNLRKIIKKVKILRENQLGDVILPELLFIDAQYQYKDQVLDQAVEVMVNKGYVDQEFLFSVYKREGILPTYLQGGVAIPHGDGGLVTKPVISITKLVEPIIWDGIHTVDIIFVLALKEDSKKYVEQLYQLISNEGLITAIRNSNSKENILEIFHLNTKSVK